MLSKKILFSIGALVVLVILAVLSFGGDRPVAPENTPKTPPGNQVNETVTPDIISGGALGLPDNIYQAVAGSIVEWEGRRTLIAGYIDNGTLGLKDGRVTVKDGAVVSGEVVFDMTTIKTLATGRGSGQDQMAGHLKSDAFFDVAKFPTATLNITSATPVEGEIAQYLVKGDLTIKGITNSVEIPAAVTFQNDSLLVSGRAVLDRSKWDIRYGSKTFFNDLADNVIDDNFTVTMTLEFRGETR